MPCSGFTSGFLGSLGLACCVVSTANAEAVEVTLPLLLFLLPFKSGRISSLIASCCIFIDINEDNGVIKCIKLVIGQERLR
jgi:hypothetical protein